jgi:hypothetical protein
MDRTQVGPLADGLDPSVSGPAIEALTVPTAQDRPLGSLADRQVDRPRYPRDERNGGWFCAFAHNPECPVPPVEAEILDVGHAGLCDPQPVEAEQKGQGDVVVSEVLGGEEERAQFAPIESSPLRREDPGPTDVLGRVALIRPSM